MSQGKAIRCNVGRVNKDRLYIELKNSAVYCYKQPLEQKKLHSLVESLKFSEGKVKLKYWQQVRRADGSMVEVS